MKQNQAIKTSNQMWNVFLILCKHEYEEEHDCLHGELEY